MNKQLQSNRKTKLSMALGLALGVGMAATSMTAQAVQLENNDGLGDAGIFQYYTVNGGWQTFIRIINTSDVNAASVKVRFREAANSREVLDFIVFLSPSDMWAAWTAPLANNAAGAIAGPGVQTKDRSCLYPKPQDNNIGVGFWYQDAPTNILLGANFQKTGFTAPDYDDDASVTSDARLTEGHLEIIGIAQHGPGAFTSAVTHNDLGVPADCGAARTLFDQDDTNATDMGNVLGMNGYIVNVTSGQGGGYDPDILANFAGASLVAAAARSATDPDLDSADPGVFAGMHPGIKQKGYPFGPAFTSNQTPVTGGVDAVSWEFMRSSVMNEWAADAVGGSVITDYFTQWVLTFPTKHYYVDLQTDGELRDDVSPTLVDPSVGNDAIMPFNKEFDWAMGESCEPYRMRMWNREEEDRSFSSPGPLISLDLCYETNVLVFDPVFNALGLASNFEATIDPVNFPRNGDGSAAVKGWASMDFASMTENLNLGLHSNGGLVENRRVLCTGSNAGDNCMIGLPVTGYMLTIYNTGAAVNNHTTINSHKYMRDGWMIQP